MHARRGLIASFEAFPGMPIELLDTVCEVDSLDSDGSASHRERSLHGME